MEVIDEVVMEMVMASETVKWRGLLQQIKPSELCTIKSISRGRCGRGLS